MSIIKRILLGAVIMTGVLIGALIIFIVGSLVFFSAQSSGKMQMLHKAADARAKELSTLVIVTGQSPQAKALVNGDSLTANTDPGQSTSAETSFSFDRTLGDIRREVELNVAKSGYKPMVDTEGVLYKTDNPIFNDGVSRTQIEVYYKKDSESVLTMRYTLDKEYTCPQGYICSNRLKDYPTKLKQYEPGPFEQFKSTGLKVILQAERGSSVTY